MSSHGPGRAESPAKVARGVRCGKAGDFRLADVITYKFCLDSAGSGSLSGFTLCGVRHEIVL